MENNFNKYDKNLKNFENEKFSQNIILFFLFLTFIVSLICIMLGIVEIENYIGIMLILGLCVMVLIFLSLSRQRKLFNTSRDLLNIAIEQKNINNNLTSELKTKSEILNDLKEENERILKANYARNIGIEKQKFYQDKDQNK